MNDNKLLLVTTAVDPWYQLSVFPSYLKNYVKEQLKFSVKKCISFKADQKCDSPMLPPDKPKLQCSVNFDPKKFSTYCSLCRIKYRIEHSYAGERATGIYWWKNLSINKGPFCYREF